MQSLSLFLQMHSFQCPLEGGNAVHRARAMLRGLGKYNFLGTDCIGTNALKQIPGHGTPANGDKLSVIKKEAINPAAWHIYPNPTRSYLHIDGEYLEQLSSVDLYDLSGKLQQNWLSANVNSTYQLSGNLPSGIYLLKLRLVDGSQVHRRIVINK